MYIRQEKIAPAGVFQTPPDVKKCFNFREDGPSPCWFPHCDCIAYDEVARKYERAKKLWVWTVIFPCVVVLVIATVLLLTPKARAGDWKTIPYFCHAMYGMPRNCDSVKSFTKRWGRGLAFRMARACGASEADLTEAQACLTDSPPFGPGEGAR